MAVVRPSLLRCAPEQAWLSATRWIVKRCSPHSICMGQKDQQEYFVSVCLPICMPAYIIHIVQWSGSVPQVWLFSLDDREAY